MKIGLLMTGEELLTGETWETNSSRITDSLAPLGLEVRTKTVVGDNLNDLVKAIRFLLKAHELIIVNGGLGPTQDDLTHEALAIAVQTQLQTHPDALNTLKQYGERRKLNLDALQKKQARLPEGAHVFDNSIGSAAGASIETTYRGQKRWLITTPGPPRELMLMLQDHIVPYLKDILGLRDQSHTTKLAFFGLGESDIQNHLETLSTQNVWPTVGVSFRVNFPVVELKLTPKPPLKPTDQAFLKLIDTVKHPFQHELVWESNTPSQAHTIASTLIKTLIDNNKTLCLAESCTGGLASYLICKQPGASKAYLGGIVSYDNHVKAEVLGVDTNQLDHCGAVSAQVALAMVRGALHTTGATHGISFTGIAGPSGGSPEKPIGTVYIAWGSCDDLRVRGFLVERDRATFQTLVAHLGLDLLRRFLARIEDEPPYFVRLSIPSTILSNSPD